MGVVLLWRPWWRRCNHLAAMVASLQSSGGHGGGVAGIGEECPITPLVTRYNPTMYSREVEV
jgi:hypothetical protein